MVSWCSCPRLNLSFWSPRSYLNIARSAKPLDSKDQDVFGYQQDVWLPLEANGYVESLNRNQVKHIALESIDGHESFLRLADNIKKRASVCVR